MYTHTCVCEISNVPKKVQYFPSIPVILYVRQKGQLSPRGVWLGVWTGQETCNEAGWVDVDVQIDRQKETERGLEGNSRETSARGSGAAEENSDFTYLV